METLFDAYLIVDWSSNSSPKKGADSIWLGWTRRAEEARVCVDEEGWILGSQLPAARQGGRLEGKIAHVTALLGNQSFRM